MTKIIGMSGKKQSGKGTACKFLIANSLSLFGTDAIGVFPMAEPLKRLCVDILGLEERQVYGSNEDKNTLTRYQWGDLPHHNPGDRDYERMTARQVIQEVGTGIFRRMWHDVWNQACIRAIQKSGVEVALIDDIRFPDEVAAVHAAGGVVIRLTRDVFKGQDQHQSELALDRNVFDWEKFDDVINNENCDVEQANLSIVHSLHRVRYVTRRAIENCI